MSEESPEVHRAGWTAIAPLTLHDLMKLRVDVFVVEQACPYPEFDGRDVEPATEHRWTADEKGPTAYLRVLSEPDGAARVGRVCTRPDARGAGLSRRLLSDVLTDADTTGRPVVLEAQSYLAGWYARFGFEPTGPEYLDDGIPHLPMRRGARAPSVPPTTGPLTAGALTAGALTAGPSPAR
jgi:ElaA protein